MISVLILNNMATYKELKYELSIEEAIDLFEICMVNAYNRNTAMEEAKERTR